MTPFSQPCRDFRDISMVRDGVSDWGFRSLYWVAEGIPFEPRFCLDSVMRVIMIVMVER